jgi:hypothetical protein
MARLMPPCSMQRLAVRQQVRCSVAYADGLQTDSRVSLAEPQHKYMLGELLGTGTAGRVVVGTDAATQAQYAVKILSKLRGAKDRTDQIKQEVRGTRSAGIYNVYRFTQYVASPGWLAWWWDLRWLHYCVVPGGWGVEGEGGSKHNMLCGKINTCPGLQNFEITQVTSNMSGSTHLPGWACDDAELCLPMLLLPQITISKSLQHCRHAVKTVDSFEVSLPQQARTSTQTHACNQTCTQSAWSKNMTLPGEGTPRSAAGTDCAQSHP